MEVRCNKCSHKWDFKGKAVRSITCPKCKLKTNAFIVENIKYVKPAKCLGCGRKFFKSRKSQKYCGITCNSKAAAKLGGKAVHEKYDFKGKNNPNWKGGISKNNYHYKKIQVQRYPKRVKSRDILNRKIRSGKIKAPKRCQKCNKKTKTHAHHEDYSKPLDVIWLCSPCHRKLHA